METYTVIIQEMSTAGTTSHGTTVRETWTRNTLAGAKGLADNLARFRGRVAVVTLTETGWEEYRSDPEQFKDIPDPWDQEHTVKP